MQDKIVIGNRFVTACQFPFKMHKAIDIKTNKEVYLKTELVNTKFPTLQFEGKLYKYLRGESSV